MSRQHDHLPFERASQSGAHELVDALNMDAARRLAAPTPDMPTAFVGAVARRRRARVAVRLAVVAAPIVALAVIAGVMWPTPKNEPEPTRLVTAPPSAEMISEAPSAAELARVNRGRSGEGLVLPESGGVGGEVITAGTRVDSPAAARVVK